MIAPCRPGGAPRRARGRGPRAAGARGPSGRGARARRAARPGPRGRPATYPHRPVAGGRQGSAVTARAHAGAGDAWTATQGPPRDCASPTWPSGCRARTSSRGSGSSTSRSRRRAERQRSGVNRQSVPRAAAWQPQQVASRAGLGVGVARRLADVLHVAPVPVRRVAAGALRHEGDDRGRVAVPAPGLHEDRAVGVRGRGESRRRLDPGRSRGRGRCGPEAGPSRPVGPRSRGEAVLGGLGDLPETGLGGAPSPSSRRHRPGAVCARVGRPAADVRRRAKVRPTPPS